MSCPECVCGLLLGIHSEGWGLVKVITPGYREEILGLKPLLVDFPDVLVFRLNVHYPVRIVVGASLPAIEGEARERGYLPIRCPLQPEQPEKCEEGEKDRIRSLGLPLGHVNDI